MRVLYTVLFYLALPFILLRLLFRSREMPAYRKKWGERFGLCPFQWKESIWIHAVSVGESIAAIGLIRSLQKDYPHLPIVVTHMTPTGAERVKAVFGDTLSQAYIPYDVPFFIKRFLDRIHPRMLIVMETELWPNLFALCHQRGIPIMIANARLSERSMQKYASFLMTSLRRDLFKGITLLAAQSSLDAEHFIQLGLDKNKIHVTGNLKFDFECPKDLSEQKALLLKELRDTRFIWIAASTHPGEEELILAAHRIILQAYPSTLLILVPRHPNRFDSVASLIEKRGLSFVRRSLATPCTEHTEVYLGDSMGELLLLYSVADVAWVGGSFAKIGGHNLLEPAALKKPILTGPELFNFTEISKLLLDAKGMTIVKTSEELALNVIYYHSHPNAIKEVGNQAYQVVAANRGALEKHRDLIKAIVIGHLMAST